MSYLHNYSAESVPESELVSGPGADKVASLSKPERDLLICRSIDYRIQLNLKASAVKSYMEIVIVFERGLGISFARVDRLNSIKTQKQDQAEVSGAKIKHNIYNS